MSKSVEPPKKSPRRPSAELKAMHQIDCILSELPDDVAYRVLRWALNCREMGPCNDSTANSPPNRGTEGD